MRKISTTEHERFVKALDYLQTELTKRHEEELAERINVSKERLHTIYEQYSDYLINIEKVIESSR